MVEASRPDVSALRAFNRLYTNRLGLLQTRLDRSAFTLSEARILYELATHSDPTAAMLARELRMDRAQISRTLRRFAERGLVAFRDDPEHGRQQLLALTPGGRAAFADLDRKTQDVVGALLDELGEVKSSRLLGAAAEIGRLLARERDTSTVALRGLRPGDLGMVTARQGAIYAREYGWDRQYEALVARILAEFSDAFDAARDDAWIAEIDGDMVGSVFLVRGDEPGTAKLRLLYVEPAARGAGVGALLVSTCIQRAKALGYARLALWTNDVLVAARRIYERAGFKLVDQSPHRSFGQDLVGQTWALDLIGESRSDS